MEMVVVMEKRTLEAQTEHAGRCLFQPNKARLPPVVLFVRCLSFSHAHSRVEPPGLHVVQNI